MTKNTDTPEKLPPELKKLKDEARALDARAFMQDPIGTMRKSAEILAKIEAFGRRH